MRKRLLTGQAFRFLTERRSEFLDGEAEDLALSQSAPRPDIYSGLVAVREGSAHAEDLRTARPPSAPG
jgi:hypothetical protein